MPEPGFFSLTLAQADGGPPPGAEAVPPPPGEGTPATGAPGGGGPAGGTRTADPLGSLFPLLLLVLVAMIAFTMFGQRRDRKKRQAMLDAVRKHDRVQTVGGIIGSIVEVKPDAVVLKVDESSNTRITFARSAIQQVLSSTQDDEKADA